MLERALGERVDPRDSALEWIRERADIFGWWTASRIIIVGAALVLHGLRRPRGYFGAHIFNHVLGPLEAWDGVWYRRIAEHGYLLVPGRQSDPAFFPFYPMLLKIADALGISTGAAGVVLSTVFFLAALLVFDALGRELFSPSLARRATLLLAVFPTSYVCSMVYPESLVLLAFALTGLFALRGRWVSCAATAAIAGLARPEGILLAIPIAGIVYARRRVLSNPDRGRAVAAILSAPAATLSFPVYLGWALHDPFAWSKAEKAWGRSFRWDGIFLAFRHVHAALGHDAWIWRDIALCFMTLALLGAAWRVGTPRGWLLLGAAIVILPLGSGAFASDARFGLLALPAYWGLAWLARNRFVFAVTALVCAALLAAATVTLPLVFP